MTGHLFSAKSEGWWARLGRTVTPGSLANRWPWSPLQHSCPGRVGAQSMRLNVPQSLTMLCIKSPLPKYCLICNILQLASTYGLGKAFLSTVPTTHSIALGQRSVQHHLADKGQVEIGTQVWSDVKSS